MLNGVADRLKVEQKSSNLMGVIFDSLLRTGGWRLKDGGSSQSCMQTEMSQCRGVRKVRRRKTKGQWW